jgi:FkbM family methyltransferase
MFEKSEALLAKKNEKGNYLSKKLVPPEYLYATDSWRQVKRKGINLNLDISNVVDHEIYFNLYDQSFSKFITEVESLKIFWDVGANIGWTLLQVNKCFPEAEIYAFEPSSKNRKRLKEHTTLNKVNAEVIPCGLGNAPSSFKLFSVLENNPGMNRILETETDLPFESIDVITGTYFWKKIGKPKVDALKIDVEGFEMFVLEGMEEMLAECKPAIFIEVDDQNLRINNSSASQLLTWLSERGYQLFDAKEKGFISPPYTKICDHFDVIAK